MQFRTRWAAASVGAVLVALVPVVLAGAADGPAAARTDTVGATADTTITQVPQDGDARGRTTLASCPATCDGNPRGERDAVLAFDVPAGPAGATVAAARLEVHTWTAVPATVAAHAVAGGATSPGTWADRPALGAPLGTRTALVAGANTWDVTAAVRGAGGATFALVQSTRTTRTYWASRENADPALRPRLVVTWSAGATTPPTTSPAPGWRLAWNDEFDGTAVDPAKWHARAEGRDIDKGCNTARPQNVSVGGGRLTIRALREPYPCAGGTRQYTEGYLDTIGRHSWTYGRFEVRAKSPTGPTGSRGLWPAFWLRPEDGGHGEIDVMELPGGASWHGASTQAIFYDYTPVKQDHRTPFEVADPAADFHTYATEWEPGVLRWYVDGRLVWTRDRSTTPWFDEAFSRPFNLRLNLQVGGWLGDPDASTVFPADFVVDWVRVYQR